MDLVGFPPRMKRTVFASVIGNGLEWYDFVIFGYFSPIFSKHFFPEESPMASLIQVFIIFAIGFVFRPLGAFIFGKIADQQGRKRALLLSVLLMAFSTSLIGFLPTYGSVGVFAPIALTLLRIGQGISMGGEFTSSLSFVIEHTPSERKGLIGAWVYAGGFLGSSLGASVSALVTLTTSVEQLNSWGWRLPFIFGFVIAFLGYYLRVRTDETPVFLELKRTQSIEKLPFKKVFKEHFLEILLVIGILLPNTMFVYLMGVFMPNYMNRMMGLDYTLSLLINLIPALVSLMTVPIAGYLSDLWGRRRVIFVGQCLLIALSPLVFRALTTLSFYELLSVQLLVSLALALSSGPIPALLTEMFPASIRNSGMSISYQFGTGVFGGMTPLIITMLISSSRGVLCALLWMVCTVLVGMLALSRVKEPNKQVLPR